MTFALASGVITQTGTDTSLAGLVGLAGVTVNTSPNGVRFYLVDATVTLININGTLSWDSDSECLVLSESTRVEQNAPAVVTIGVVATVNGKTRYSRGTGLVINRANSGLNLSATSWWMKSSTSLDLGSKLIVNGGQIKTRGSIFLGTTTNPVNQFATIELNGRAEVLNLATIAVQVIRSFVQPSGIQLVSGVLSGRTVNSSVFSSVGFGTLAVEADFASFQCDGNGPKNPVTVDNGVFADNKSTTDYTYVTAGNLLANINKYIFQDPDVGSALRTIGASAGAWRQGVVEINKDVRFEVVDSSNAPIEGAATYVKMLGATINPAGRYAGIDDYITPRVYVDQTNASGLTTAASILYAVAQGYATDATGAGTALTMESLTTRSGDVQDGYIWSYGHLLGPTAVPMRGVNQLTVGWTLFADPNVTLSRSAAAALTTITTLSDLYDAAKFWKTSPIQAQLEFPTIDTLLITANGSELNLGSQNLVVDGTAAPAFAVNTGTSTITINASVFAAGSKFNTITTTGVISSVNGASITFGFVDANGNSFLTFEGVDTWAVYSDANRLTQIGTGTAASNFRFNYVPGTTYYLTLVSAGVTFLLTVPPTQSGQTVVSLSTQALLVALQAKVDAVPALTTTQVWTAPTRTLTSGGGSGGGGSGGGATAQEVWEYANRTLTAGIPTAVQNATAVRTELATELGRVDVATSTRLAATAYTAPANADIAAIKTKTDTLVNGPTLAQIEASIVLAKEATVASRASQASVTALGTPLQASGYTAPDNASIAAIKAKTDTLVNGPTLAQIEGSTVLAKEASVQAVKSTTGLIPYLLVK